MSEVSISFERDVEAKQVNVNLINGDDFDRVPESDTRVKWARLAMRYAQQIAEAKTLEFNPYIVDTGAVINFTGVDDHFDDFDEEDDEYDEFGRFIEGFAQLHREEGEENAIGFSLDTGDAYKRIGGLATPSVQLAGVIHQLLLRARSRAS